MLSDIKPCLKKFGFARCNYSIHSQVKDYDGYYFYYTISIDGLGRVGKLNYLEKNTLSSLISRKKVMIIERSILGFSLWKTTIIGSAI